MDGVPILKLRYSLDAMEVSRDRHPVLVMPIGADFEARTTQFPDC